jgi:hypothetical protein
MTTSQRPAYQPSGDELLIYELAKFQGKTQSEVASMFGINQSTVSRILQRVERWQAHAKARENGRLDHQERLAAQRWLTYERNELILASCLRIAHEMEGFTELSKNTISRPVDSPAQKQQIRTEGRTIDRHGIAARFLRLAWRINMDQLKLTEQLAKGGDLPTEPLTEEELAAEAHQAALDAAELDAARQPGSGVFGGEPSPITGDLQPPKTPDPLVLNATQPSAPLSHHSPTHHSPPPLHNPHNDSVLEIVTTPNAPCTCHLQPAAEKNSPHTCIIDCDQPSWPHDTQARSASEGTGSRLGFPDLSRAAAH